MTSFRSRAASERTSSNRSSTCFRFSALIGVPSAIRSVKITECGSQRKAQRLELQHSSFRVLPFFERTAELTNQLVEVKGLAEHGDVAELALPAIRVRAAGDDDGRDVAHRRILAPLREKLPAVHDGHGQVEHDRGNVARVRLEVLQRVASV